jgi:hypothetical protein
MPNIIPSAHTQWVASYRTCAEGLYWASVRVMFVATALSGKTGERYYFDPLPTSVTRDLLHR